MNIQQVVGVTFWIIGVGFFLPSRWYPSLTLAILFWGSIKLGEVLWWIWWNNYGAWDYVARICVFLGGFSNGVAVIANGGFMPVVGQEVASGIHIPATERTALPWLIDRFWYGVSVGDLIVGVGIGVWVVAGFLFLVRRYG